MYYIAHRNEGEPVIRKQTRLCVKTNSPSLEAAESDNIMSPLSGKSHTEQWPEVMKRNRKQHKYSTDISTSWTGRQKREERREKRGEQEI